MLTQEAPPLSQRRHKYVYVSGTVPPHVPGSAVRIPPDTGVPLIVGGAVLTGAAVMTAVAADTETVEPDALVAVTATRIVEPVSLASVYVVAVAPSMSAQVAPVESQRRHW